MDNDTEIEVTEYSEYPEFVLEVYDDGTDLELSLNLPREPDITKHASVGLLYALAILTLDRQGTLNKLVDQILMQGPINEVDCANRITLLMHRDSNDLPS